jgi:PAS domain S-box-containing protein
MSFFPFLHFFNTIVYLYLAIYILIKSPKALANRIWVAFLLCFGLWSAGMIFVHNPHTSKEVARLVTDICAAGWVGFSSFLLWFILVFSGKRKILKKRWLYLVLFGIPLAVIYKQWTGSIITDFSSEYYGLKPIFKSSIWTYLFFFYSVSFTAAALYINLDFLKTARSPVLKKQAKIITVSFVIPLILATITDIILPLAKIHIIPDGATTFSLIWAAGVVFAMVKYNFLTITPAEATENIISTMFDALILLNLKEEIIYVNQAALSLSGYNEKELKGLSIRTLFPERHLKDDSFEKTFTEGNLKNRDLILETKNEGKVPVLFSGSRLREEEGTSAGGFVCVIRDISERKKLEEELLKSKKLETLGILAGGIAHDFNNLLSAIMGNISLVQDMVSPREKSRVFLKKAEEASLQAASLASKFITFSPGGWLHKKEITLSNILKNIRFSELSKKNVDYDMAIPTSLFSIYADEEQMHQVFENLFTNALEAMPGGGKISLQAKNVTVNAGSKLPLKKGKYVQVLITDNGVGIPPDKIDKIFDPYFSSKERNAEKGIGLGLTVCYSILNKHKGHISVESKEGQGTTAALFLPAYN